MSKLKKPTNIKFLTNRRSKLLGLVILCLVIAYILTSRAVDTGSWWEYGGAFVFVMVALNRFGAALKGVAPNKKS